MKYNRQQIIERYHQEEKIKYLFFWGHQPAKNGQVTKSCFSQWWQQTFEVDKVTYKSAEHWMMAEKARLFNDKEMWASIIAAETPGEAKKLGRQVSNFDMEVWDQHKSQIVIEGNKHKFEQAEDQAEFLLNTKERVIVEASPRDRIWGIGMSQNHHDAEHPDRWRGQNLLGFALMEVRDLL